MNGADTGVGRQRAAGRNRAEAGAAAPDPGASAGRLRLLRWPVNVYSIEAETNPLGRFFIFTKK